MSYDWVHGLLEDWGEAIHKEMLHSGYPAETWLYRALKVGTRSPMRPSDKILCLDLGYRVSKTHRAVMSLRRELRGVLGAKFIWIVDSKGRGVMNIDRARELGVSRDNFRELVREGKKGAAIAIIRAESMERASKLAVSRAI